MGSPGRRNRLPHGFRRSRYGDTLAVTDVLVVDGVKPAGGVTEMVVDPMLFGVNAVATLSKPGWMVTDGAIVPTAGLLLFRVTVTGETPPRSGCVVPVKQGGPTDT